MDETERAEKRRGREGRASPASFDAELLDHLADAVLVADTDGRYVEANLAAVTLLGYSRAELLSMGVADVTAAPPAWSQSEYVRFSKDGYWRGMLDLRRKDGTLVRVDARASVLKGPEGRWASPSCARSTRYRMRRRRSPSAGSPRSCSPPTMRCTASPPTASSRAGIPRPNDSTGIAPRRSWESTSRSLLPRNAATRSRTTSNERWPGSPCKIWRRSGSPRTVA